MSEWYEAGTKLPLQQGDFFRNLNIYVQDSPEPKADDEEPSEALVEGFPLSIVVSQSCDLKPQPGEEFALLCPIREMQEISRSVGKGTAESIWNSARAGRALHYFALPECKLEAWEFPVALVDFRRVFEMKTERLQEICVNEKQWLRLASPYRELMAQQFARKIMRVALVTDERPEWDDIKATLPGKDTVAQQT